MRTEDVCRERNLKKSRQRYNKMVRYERKEGGFNIVVILGIYLKLDTYIAASRPVSSKCTYYNHVSHKSIYHNEITLLINNSIFSC